MLQLQKNKKESTNYMDNWVYTELLFPIISAGIGAVIGGLFAYKIAKERFASDYINEGKSGFLIINSSAESIAEWSRELRNLLINSTKYPPTDFLLLLFDKNKILEDYLNSLASDWEHHREKISYCTMPHVCKNPSERNEYIEIYALIIDTYRISQDYQLLAKKYVRKFKRNPDTEELEDIKFYETKRSLEMLNSAKDYLEELEKNCNNIIERCRHL